MRTLAGRWGQDYGLELGQNVFSFSSYVHIETLVLN
jgi:hypothetical protein